ncbi:DUF4339 domain-containing protein [Myxococcota bacterium]
MSQSTPGEVPSTPVAPTASQEFDDEDATVVFDRSSLLNLNSAPSHPPPTQHGLAVPPVDWHLALGGAQSGPFTTEELAVGLETGKWPADVLVWRDGFSDWKHLNHVPELSGISPMPGSAPPAAPSSRPSGTGSLSPVEHTASPPGPFGELLQIRHDISPWAAMIAAVFVGLGVSFLVIRLVGASETTVRVEGAVPGASTAGPAKAQPPISPASFSPRRIHRPALQYAVTVQGTLPDTAVHKTLNQNRRVQTSLDECREEHGTWPASEPSGAFLDLTLRIDATGCVYQVRHTQDPAGYPGLGLCMAGRARTWEFAVSPGMTSVKLALKSE